MIRRTPLRRVSKKRKQALTEYYRRRMVFLVKHPFCQVWLMENGFDENKYLQAYVDLGYHLGAPPSTEIHHTKKPKQTYLNDETTWLAVCSDMHKKIENNKSWAREKGYLQNI